MHALLERFDEDYRAKSEQYWNPGLKTGVYSSLNPSELAGLASRDEKLVERFGRRLPKIFEHQLALLAQSFGFIVVQTRTGERTVDLLCISPDPSVRFTFLLEAKTTAAKYSLPASDERALMDYVRDVRASLTTLPELRLLLLVGPIPTNTLTKKLRDLEGKISLPVRYCHANELAGLREALPGPLPAAIFLEEALAAPYVMPSGYTAAAVARTQARQEAHAALVRSLMSKTPRNEKPEAQPWSGP